MCETHWIWVTDKGIYILCHVWGRKRRLENKRKERGEKGRARRGGQGEEGRGGEREEKKDEERRREEDSPKSKITERRKKMAFIYGVLILYNPSLN